MGRIVGHDDSDELWYGNTALKCIENLMKEGESSHHKQQSTGGELGRWVAEPESKNIINSLDTAASIMASDGI